MGGEAGNARNTALGVVALAAREEGRWADFCAGGRLLCSGGGVIRSSVREGLLLHCPG